MSDINFKLNGIVPGLGGDIVMAGGNQFFLDPTNGSDSNDGKSPTSAFLTLPVAFAALTNANNDILFLIGGSKPLDLSATFTWNKSYTHLIGLCSATGVDNRARIFQLAGTTFTPLLTISATGCFFKNFEIAQGPASNAALVDVAITAGRNRFENVHFAGMSGGNATATGGRAVTITGVSASNTFIDCVFGTDTASLTATNYQLAFSTNAPRNYFKNCKFLRFTATGGDGGSFIYAPASSIDRWAHFQNCLFINSGVASGGIIDAQGLNVSLTAGGAFILQDCGFTGVTAIQTSATANVIYIGAVPTAASTGLGVHS